LMETKLEEECQNLFLDVCMFVLLVVLRSFSNLL
jgi:hypothetical protein